MNVPTMCRRALVGVVLALAAVASTALGNPVQAAGPPTLSPLQIKAGGTLATVAFTSSEPVTVAIDFRPATAGAITTTAAALTSQPAQPITSGIIAANDPRFTNPYYGTTHEQRLTGLKSNTPYTVVVTARTPDNRTATAQGNFTTARKRIRLVLDEITVSEDGDWFGKGEPTWFWSVFWDGGRSGGCFPNTTPSGVAHLSGVCQAGSYGEGTFVPRNDRNEKLALTFAEENFPVMPTSFSLHAWSTEEDLIDPLIWLVSQVGHEFIPVHASMPLPEPQVPQGREWASTPITLSPHCDGCSVESTMNFRVDVFYDNLPYPPNHGRTQVHSNF
ncbi:MAG: hypothetical protein AB7R89_17640 [Dehalococcoidia bacterium]